MPEPFVTPLGFTGQSEMGMQNSALAVTASIMTTKWHQPASSEYSRMIADEVLRLNAMKAHV
jgi:hypothetical protein